MMADSRSSLVSRTSITVPSRVHSSVCEPTLEAGTMYENGPCMYSTSNTCPSGEASMPSIMRTGPIRSTSRESTSIAAS